MLFVLCVYVSDKRVVQIRPSRIKRPPIGHPISPLTGSAFKFPSAVSDSRFEQLILCTFILSALSTMGGRDRHIYRFFRAVSATDAGFEWGRRVAVALLQASTVTLPSSAVVRSEQLLYAFACSCYCCYTTFSPSDSHQRGGLDGGIRSTWEAGNGVWPRKLAPNSVIRRHSRRDGFRKKTTTTATVRNPFKYW